MRSYDERQDDICNQCSGSGEGYIEGSTCHRCKGSGSYFPSVYEEDYRQYQDSFDHDGWNDFVESTRGE